MLDSIMDSIDKVLIRDNRWKYLVDGLQTTLIITLFALLIGLVIGFFLAVIRVIHDSTGRLRVLNVIARLYLTVIRGIPVVVQLLIMYFFIMASTDNGTLVAIAAFGINSGAYVAEIFRGGIMSVDAGQMEAGRSLGLNYTQTMIRIVMPQAIKNCLPALGNEFITLLKETSVAGYVAIRDLTKGGDIIRSVTYAPDALFFVAGIYLVLVIILEFLVGRLERRLRRSDRR